MNPTADLQSFFGAWELFELPALAATFAGAALGLLGVYVVLRRLVFLSAAVSQAAGLGVALALFAGHLGAAAFLASPLLGASATTLAAVLLIATARGSRRASPVGHDALLGFVWLLGAAGTLAVGTRLGAEMHDVEGLLFGSAVAVSPADFAVVRLVTFAVLVLQLWWWRGFASVSFDPVGARVRGLPVRILDLALYVSLALAISVSTRVLGALPTFAFSVLPALAAVRLVANVPRALLLGTVLGAASGFVGYVVAYLWQLPVGAAQTLVALAIVIAVWPLGRLRGR